MSASAKSTAGRGDSAAGEAAQVAAPPADRHPGQQADQRVDQRVDRQAACAAISDWRPEIIELPPEFAPSLPKGREELRFAPGMFKPETDTYFTYAFALAFAEGTDLRRERIDSMLDDYFRGLMTAVAKSRKIDLPVATIDAEVTAHSDGMRARVALIDAFVTGKPFTLLLDIDIDGSCVRVRASPKPYADPVWRKLAHAVTCLPC